MKAAHTKSELLEAIDNWEADPDGVPTCDLLCWVADCLDLDNAEYSPDKLRELIEASDLKEKMVGLDITEDANDPRAVCAGCAENHDGEPIYRNDEWGGDKCVCADCGVPLDVTLV